MMAISIDWSIFTSISQDKTASSTFQVPVWSLGTQLEVKVSREFLKNECQLIFGAFNSNDKFLIGNGHWDIED